MDMEHNQAQSGLAPDRQSVFFTAVSPIDNQLDQREVEFDLDKPRIAPYKHTWRAHHNTAYWCNLNLAQRKGLRFYQTRSPAFTLSDTLPVIIIDKVVCMETREELYCRIYKTPRLPRVTLVPNATRSEGCTYFRFQKNPMTVRMKFISTGRLAAVTIVLILNPWNSKFRC